MHTLVSKVIAGAVDILSCYLETRTLFNCARDHFANKGVHIDTIQLYGSMELAPLVGMADAIVDLVSTGNTLKANGLVEVEPIADISARLVINQASYKRKRAQLQPIFDLLK